MNFNPIFIMLYQTFILIFLFLCSKLSITSILKVLQLMAERLLLTQLSSIAWVFGLFLCSLSFQLQQESLIILRSRLYWNKLILIYLEVCNILRLVLLTNLKCILFISNNFSFWLQKFLISGVTLTQFNIFCIN